MMNGFRRPANVFSSGMLNTRKCRTSLTYHALLRCCTRTRTSLPRFERDALPHEGLSPRPDHARPRAVTPAHEDRREAPRRSQQQSAAPWSSPISTGSTRRPLAAVRRELTIDDFFHPPQSVSVPSSSGRTSKSSDDELPAEFTSPPLLPALRNSLMETLGPFAHPTPIQSLSLKWVLQEPQASPTDQPNAKWRQFFLASETGSGKSIAYLLPLLQSVKQAELAEKGRHRSPSSNSNRLYNPRALILAPTHELTRQLSGFAKSLLHVLKLRVLCASQANTKNTKTDHKTSRKMGTMFDGGHSVEGVGEFDVSDKGRHGVDVLVGTPMKLLELVRGRGWDKRREEGNEEDNEDADDEASGSEKRKPRRGRDFTVGLGRKLTTQLGLQNVEWVVVDEADVLLDTDFQATTRLLLSDISAARGHPMALTSAPELEGSPQKLFLPSPTPITYPFNFILTSATIPNSLNNYLQNHHPSLIRLSSPNLHHLPKSLEIEYVSWSGGNKFADIHRRIRQIWSEDAASSPGRTGELSKVLIFCNRTSKTVELSEYLKEHGIGCVPMTTASKHRVMGTNRHLFGFLKKSIVDTASRKKALKRLLRGTEKIEKPAPLVMVTTSLLSRGLDFSPEVKHVFIVDEPRNMVDFLHRAGRSGRAGQRGKVVVFGKLSGRGSERGREVKKRVVRLKAFPEAASPLSGTRRETRRTWEVKEGSLSGRGKEVKRSWAFPEVNSLRKGRPNFNARPRRAQYTNT